LGHWSKWTRWLSIFRGQPPVSGVSTTSYTLAIPIGRLALTKDFGGGLSGALLHGLIQMLIRIGIQIYKENITAGQQALFPYQDFLITLPNGETYEINNRSHQALQA
jgi:hypothetical protein